MNTKQDTFIGREVKYMFFDKKKKEFFKSIYHAFEGKLQDMLINYKGELMLREADGMSHESTFKNRYIKIESIGSQDRNGAEVYNGSLLKDDAGGVHRVEWHKKTESYHIVKWIGQKHRFNYVQVVSKFYNPETGKLNLDIYGHTLTDKKFI